MTPKPVMLNVADFPWDSVKRGRKINIQRKLLPLDTGIPGVTVELSYMLVPDTYAVPRHRHNCDQIRYIIDGVQSIGKGQDMVPGECGYFPEGVYYGPQEQKGDCTCLLMQFQGPSGERLLTSAELDETYNRMIAAGAVFENGIWRGRKEDGSPQNKDSYVAIWEEHEQRKISFAKPRYRAPVMMLPDEFRWVPDPRRPGVEVKHLGTFCEMRTTAQLTRMAPGSTIAAQPPGDAEVRYLTEGAIEVGGKTWTSGTYWYLPSGVAAEAIASRDGATWLTIGLPMLTILKQ